MLRILHTNDLHSQLENWPAVTRYLKQARKKAEANNEDVLLFDIGDHCDRVNPVTEALLGQGNVQLLNEMNYDAVTIGNNEGITFSKQQLNDLYKTATFHVLLSNLKNQNGTRPPWALPYKVFTKPSGVRIGVTGVTIPFRLFYETLGWKVTDPAAELKKTAAKLAPEVDFLICLSHLGLSEDEKLAADLPEYDLILGAHTHHVLGEGIKINNTWINQSGRSGRYAGDVKVEFVKKNDRHFSATVKQVVSVEINGQEKDDKTSLQLKRLTEQGNRLLEKPLAVLAEDLKADWYSRSDFAVFLAEALSEWCQADVSMVNSGVLLRSLSRGRVTFKDIHEICPHPINPATVMISGERLLETIRQSRQQEMIHFALKGFGFRGKVLGYMIFDNVTLTDDSRYLSEKNVMVGNRPLERDRLYKLATLDMFTFGHLYPAISSINEKNYFMPEFLRDILAWKLTRE